MRREVRQPTTKELAEIASGRSVVRRIRRPEKQEVFSETRRSCEGKEKAPDSLPRASKDIRFCLSHPTPITTSTSDSLSAAPLSPQRSPRAFARFRCMGVPL